MPTTTFEPDVSTPRSGPPRPGSPFRASRIFLVLLILAASYGLGRLIGLVIRHFSL